MANEPLIRVPVSRLDSSKTEFLNTKGNLAALVIRGMKEGSPGFTCKMVVEGDRPCNKSRETGNKCARRLERVDQEMIDWFMTRQPAPPVLPRICSRPNLNQVELSAIQAVQDLRDFEWDILTQFGTQGDAMAWLCDCDEDDDEEEEVDPAALDIHGEP
ncbi:unnamed protein product [Alopecurus aequalis]